MAKKNLLPETIEKGTIIRTGEYIGHTAEVISALNEMGWAVVSGNDAPRGGISGNYVEVLGRLWSRATLRKHVKEAIATGDDLYRGCGIYRLAIADGKIVASLYGGYHNSRRSVFATADIWAEECRRQMEKLGTVVKADGSGTFFYIRPAYLEAAEQAGLSIKSYVVPGIKGGAVVNHEVQLD